MYAMDAYQKGTGNIVEIPPDARARQEQLQHERIARAVHRMPEPTYHLKVKRLSPNSILPNKSHPTDAGWDLHSLDSHTIKPNERRILNTGIALDIPAGYVGLIWPRSGLATKQGIDVFAGVVDSGYHGEVKVCLYNSSNTKVSVMGGDRVAQILFQKIGNITIVEAVELDSSVRGDDGFGSSGR